MEEPPNGYFSERMIIDQEILGSLFSDQAILLLQSSFSSTFSLGFTRGTSLVELDDDQFGTINGDANLMLAVYWGAASSHIRFQRSRCVWRMGMRQNLRMVRYYKWQVKWLGKNHNPDFCLLWVNCSFSRPLGFFWSQYSVKNYGLSKNPEMFSKQLNHKKFSCWLVYWLVIDGYWITPSPIQSTIFFVCGSKTSCFQAEVKKLSERVRPEAGGVRCGCEESKGCGTFFGFRPSKLWGYRCVFFYMDEFDHDLTVLPHWKSWLIRGIIPKWPQDSGWWNIIIYPYIYIYSHAIYMINDAWLMNICCNLKKGWTLVISQFFGC